MQTLVNFNKFYGFFAMALMITTCHGLAVMEMGDNPIIGMFAKYGVNGTGSSVTICRGKSDDTDMAITLACINLATTRNIDIIYAVSYPNMAMNVGSALKTTPMMVMTTSSLLINRNTYPSAFIPLSVDPIQGYVISLICKYYKWEQVAILTSFGTETETLTQFITSSNTQFGIKTYPQTYRTNQDPTEQLMLIKSEGYYIIILSIAYQDANKVMAIIAELGLNKPPYQLFISFQLMRVNMADTPLTNITKIALQGSIGVMPGIFNQNQYNEAVYAYNKQTQYYVPPSSIGIGLGYFYDTARHMGVGIKLYQRLTNSNNCSNTTTGNIPRCLNLLKQSIRDAEYDGVFGRIHFDENLIRDGPWTLYNIIEGNIQNPVGIIRPKVNTTTLQSGILKVNADDIDTMEVYGGDHMPTFMDSNATDACNLVNNPYKQNRSNVDCRIIWSATLSDIIPVAYARLSTGEKIPWDFDAIIMILASAIAIFTAWIGKMLIRQLIYSVVSSDKRSRDSATWIILSSCVFAFGIWSCMIIIPTAIIIKSNPVIAIAFNGTQFILSVLLIILTWAIAILLAIKNPYTNFRTDIISALPDVSSGLNAQEHKTQQSYIIKKFAWWGCLSGSVAAAGTIGSYFIITSGIIIACDSEYASLGTTLAIFATIILHAIAFIMLFYASISQALLTIISIAGIPLTQSLITTSELTFTYVSSYRPTSPSELSALTIQIMSVVVFVILIFLAFGINVSKLRLSVESFESTIAKLKSDKKEIELNNNELIRRQMIIKFETYAHHATSSLDEESPVVILFANIIHRLKSIRLNSRKSQTTDSDLITLGHHKNDNDVVEMSKAGRVSDVGNASAVVSNVKKGWSIVSGTAPVVATIATPAASVIVSPMTAMALMMSTSSTVSTKAMPFNSKLAAFRLGINASPKQKYQYNLDVITDEKLSDNETIKISNELKDIKVDFADVIGSIHGIEAMKAIAVKKACQENICYYCAIECYECANDIQTSYKEYNIDLTQLAKVIFNNYMAESNIGYNLIQSYRQRLAEPSFIATPNLFYEAKRAYYGLIHDNLWVDFKQQYLLSAKNIYALFRSGALSLKR